MAQTNDNFDPRTDFEYNVPYSHQGMLWMNGWPLHCINGLPNTEQFGVFLADTNFGEQQPVLKTIQVGEIPEPDVNFDTASVIERWIRQNPIYNHPDIHRKGGEPPTENYGVARMEISKETPLYDEIRKSLDRAFDLFVDPKIHWLPRPMVSVTDGYDKQAMEMLFRGIEVVDVEAGKFIFSYHLQETENPAHVRIHQDASRDEVDELLRLHNREKPENRIKNLAEETRKVRSALDIARKLLGIKRS